MSVPLSLHGCNVTMRCLVARINHKTLIVICAVFALITILLWNKCSSNRDLPTQIRPQLEFAPTPEKDEDNGQAPEAPPGSKEVTYEQIDCLINEDVIIKGRREGGEVYLPFSWVERYFDVYGRLVQYDGTERFEFSHSYSRVYAQREPYHPDGVFMSFEGYNVEVRDRVKCISGVEGSLGCLLFCHPTYNTHRVGVERFTKSSVRFVSRLCGHSLRFDSVYIINVFFFFIFDILEIPYIIIKYIAL